MSKWKTPLRLYSEKRGLIEPDNDRPEYMEWGHILEPSIATKYAEVTGRYVLMPNREHPEFPFWLDTHPVHEWMAATIDREVCDPEREGFGVLEVKTSNQYRKGDWEDGPPIYYQIQLQHQLAVTGYTWGSIAVLIGGSTFKWFDVDRNEDFITALVAECQSFNKRVVDGIPPEPGDSPLDTDTLRSLFPTEKVATCSLPASLLDWDEQRVRGEAMIADGQALVTAANNHIMKAMGEAAFGQFPNGISYSWKTVNRRGYEVKPSSYRQFRRHGGK